MTFSRSLSLAAGVSASQSLARRSASRNSPRVALLDSSRSQTRSRSREEHVHVDGRVNVISPRQRGGLYMLSPSCPSSENSVRGSRASRCASHDLQSSIGIRVAQLKGNSAYVLVRSTARCAGNVRVMTLKRGASPAVDSRQSSCSRIASTVRAPPVALKNGESFLAHSAGVAVSTCDYREEPISARCRSSSRTSWNSPIISFPYFDCPYPQHPSPQIAALRTPKYPAAHAERRGMQSGAVTMRQDCPRCLHMQR